MSPDHRHLISEASKILVVLRTDDLNEVVAIWSEVKELLSRGADVMMIGVCPSFVGGADGEGLYALQRFGQNLTGEALTRLASFTMGHATQVRPQIVQEELSAFLTQRDSPDFDLALVLAGPSRTSLGWCRHAAETVKLRRQCPVVILQDEAPRRSSGLLSGVIAAVSTFAPRLRLNSSSVA
jgi:hypothetical protein